MSSLHSQISAFKSDVTSSAARLSQKRGIGSQTTSSSLASNNDLKRKYDTTNATSAAAAAAATTTTNAANTSGNIYSQPALSGTGSHLMTQVTLAVDYLRDKDQPLTFEEIFRYLSASHIGEEGKAAIEHILKTQHSKVEYDPEGANGVGSFRFRPQHNVRSADDLLDLLQSQTTAQGIPVKELRDGWNGAIAVINALEADHQVLLTRAAKDGSAKRVWPDDPSLHHPVDTEFREMWATLKPPRTEEDLRKELVSFGLTPTSLVKAPKVGESKKDKKKRKARSGGKVTNTHMSAVLKNYEHLRK